MNPVITPLLEIHQQLQIFHWQTKSYAEHKAFGKAYEQFQDLMDAYIESLFGRTDRIYANNSFTVKLSNYDEDVVNNYIADALNYLSNKLPVEINEEVCSDLQNIRDEMIQVFTTLKYLLTLK